MSKAEDRYLELFQDGRLRNCSSKEAFLLGYHQAEKDLELTCDDIKIIINAFLDYKIESIKSGKTKKYTDEEYCAEILKRYKDFKKEKENNS